MKNIFLKLTCAVLAVLCCFSAFSGCSKTVKDAELRLPLASEPITLDPQVAQGSESKTIVANCFEGITKLNADGKAVLAAASEVTVSSDGLTYVFKLHENKKWHINSNHEELFGEDWETALDLTVTADDFVFGLQRALSPQTSAPDAHRLTMIKNAEKVLNGSLPVTALGVSAINNHTLQITLEHPSAVFLTALAEPVAMPCHREFFEATKGKHGLAAQYILCNGPFYLSRWYKGSSIVLRRNADNEPAQAKPYSVTYAFTQDEVIILENLLDGTYIAAPLSAAAAKAAKAEGCSVTQIQNSVWGLAFNCSNEVTKSAKLRLAIIKATNLSEILKAAGSDMAVQATGIIPPSCIVDGQSYTALAGSIGLPSYDEAAAKKYFDEATNGEMCELTVLCTQQYETAIRRIMQTWQQVFGIALSAKVEVLEEDELNKRVAAGQYQCALTQITTQAQEPTEFLNAFNAGGICRFTSSAYADTLNAITQAGNSTQLVEACTKAQTLLIQNGVFCPLFYKNSYVATSAKAVNVSVSHSGSIIKLDEAELLKN